MDKENQYIKSMEFCQDIIKRMADNSFRLKQWFTLTIIAFATLQLDNLLYIVLLFIFPYLDAYYLKQERIFREIYNDFMKCVNENKTNRNPFDMKPTKEQREQFSIWNEIFSISVAPFYFIIICVLQSFIVYRSFLCLSSIECPWLWMSIGILLILLIILGLIFKKKTTHQT